MVVDVKKNNKIIVSNKVYDYTTPKTIYVPIYDAQISIKNNQKVYKGQVIAKGKNKNYYSYVSGKILGQCLIKDINQKLINALAIANDFKEQVKDNNMTFDEMLLFYYPQLYKILNAKKEFLILNLVEDEPLVFNHIFIIRDYCEKILLTLDHLQRKFNYQKVILIVSQNDKEIIDRLYNHIGRYPNIDVRLVINSYGYSFKQVINQKLEKKYKSFSMLILNDIIKIYNIEKRRQITSVKYITITGNKVLKPKIIKIKYGTLLTEVISKYFKFLDKDYEIILNGLMCGQKIDLNNLCMSDKISAIMFHKPVSLMQSSCCNCGLCTRVCPLHLNPKPIMEAKKKNQVLKGCISCNLCSFICPANIKITNYLKEN